MDSPTPSSEDLLVARSHIPKSPSGVITDPTHFLQKTENGSLILRRLPQDRQEVEIIPDLIPPERLEAVQSLLKAAKASEFCKGSKETPEGILTSVIFESREDKAKKLFAYIRATSTMDAGVMPTLSAGVVFNNEDLYSGWMWKLGGKPPFKQFQRRYFILSKKAQTLAWHVETDSIPQNMLNLKDITSVEQVDKVEDQKEFCFKMSTNKKDYLLVAPDEEAYQRWMTLLRGD